MLVPFIGSGVLSEPHCRDLTALMSHVRFGYQLLVFIDTALTESHIPTLICGAGI